MNIKELGNYELVNANNDDPILVGGPDYYTFLYVDKQANDFSANQLSITHQGDNMGDAKNYVRDIIDSYYGEVGNGCGRWWYIKDIELTLISKDGAPSYFYPAYSIKVLRFHDRNFPSTTPGE